MEIKYTGSSLKAKRQNLMERLRSAIKEEFKLGAVIVKAQTMPGPLDESALLFTIYQKPDVPASAEIAEFAKRELAHWLPGRPQPTVFYNKTEKTPG